MAGSRLAAAAAADISAQHQGRDPASCTEASWRPAQPVPRHSQVSTCRAFFFVRALFSTVMAQGLSCAEGLLALAGLSTRYNAANCCA